jgi:tRNA G18 (ribose-2'-O)-methylase SpoU
MIQQVPTRPTLQEVAALPRVPLVLVLENIRSAQNVGSLFRTADAFRLEALFLCGYTAGPDNRDLRKAALGAEESVPHQVFTDATSCIETLKAEGYTIWALEQTTDSQDLASLTKPPGRLALVLGNEVEGVSPETLSLCHGAVEIAQGGIKHSLNVAVAGGIAAWHLATSAISEQSL